jgi:FixJ family two-component response regulator
MESMATHNAAQTIFIVDDDVGFQAALESLFRSVGYQTQGFHSTGAFIDSGAAAQPGCILLDVRLPGMNGLDFQEQLAKKGVTTPVVLMTGHGDIQMSVRAMKAGAVDFLTKPFREQDMLDAVRVALERDASTRADRAQADDLLQRFACLTSREREVMASVVAGKMNKQIAYELGLSEITVKIHRGNAMRKMGARSLAGLVKMAASLALQD